MRTRDGRYFIEQVVVNGRPLLRVTTWAGTWVGDYATPERMAAAVGIDLADLVEVPDISGQ